MEGRDVIKTLQEILLETLSLEDILLHLEKSELRFTFWPGYPDISHTDDTVRASVNVIDFASRCRRIDIVDKLLSRTAELNSTHQEQFNVLHYASSLGRKDLVETIIATGADVNVKSAKEDTALHFASRGGKEKEIVKILIERGADLNVKNKDGDTALILATNSTRSDCFDELIEAECDVNINMQNNDGQTALNNACLCKDTARVKALIEAGADVRIASGDNTPLLALLPSLPASTCIHVEKYDIYSGENYNSVELHRDVNNIVELLINANADVTVKDKHGNTTLHRAVLLEGNFKLIEKLIDVGVNVNEQNENGETALHCACMSNQRRAVRILKDAGADINVRSNFGDNALHYAASFGSHGPAQELIEFGIDVNVQNESGKTALHNSLLHSNFKVLETLLMNQASVNVKDNEGHDPLWYMRNEDTALHIFKLHRYFKSCKDAYGNTIFHLLIERYPIISSNGIWSFIRTNRSEFSNYLQVQNVSGQTPLHIAARTNQKALCSIFSTFDEHLGGLLLSDEFGNTFLHTLLHTHFSSETYQHAELDISFVKRLMDNDYHNCPDKIKRDLIKARNKVANTPLHMLFLGVNYCHIGHQTQEILFKLLLNAGADINYKNGLGETVLHLIMRWFYIPYELAETTIKSGSEVNVLNIFGESEIFNASLFSYSVNNRNSLDYLTFANLSGCDLKIRNRIGQTVLMLSITDTLYKIRFDFQVFDDKETINIKDDFGSNCLHYMTWKEEKIHGIRYVRS